MPTANVHYTCYTISEGSLYIIPVTSSKWKESSIAIRDDEAEIRGASLETSAAGNKWVMLVTISKLSYNKELFSTARGSMQGQTMQVEHGTSMLNKAAYQHNCGRGDSDYRKVGQCLMGHLPALLSIL
jgi:hypothetical protein